MKYYFFLLLLCFLSLSPCSAPVHAAPQTGEQVIIIALPDSGYDPTNNSTQPYIFTNPGEIPGNGKDDDGNGFKDDVHGWDFFDGDNDPTYQAHNHGPAVIEIMVAQIRLAEQLLGRSLPIKIIPLRISNELTNPNGVALVEESLNYVAKFSSVRVCNFSLKFQFYEPGVERMLAKLFATQGVISVCGAGNDSRDLRLVENKSYPASYHDRIPLLAVGETDGNGNASQQTNFGVQIFAHSFTLQTSYGLKAGTSYAAAKISAAAAILATARAELSHPWLIMQQLMASSDKLSGLSSKVLPGGGLYNLQAALTNHYIFVQLGSLELKRKSNGKVKGTIIPHNGIPPGDKLFVAGEIATIVPVKEDGSFKFRPAVPGEVVIASPSRGVVGVK